MKSSAEGWGCGYVGRRVGIVQQVAAPHCGWSVRLGYLLGYLAAEIRAADVQFLAGVHSSTRAALQIPLVRPATHHMPAHILCSLLTMASSRARCTRIASLGQTPGLLLNPSKTKPYRCRKEPGLMPSITRALCLLREFLHTRESACLIAYVLVRGPTCPRSHVRRHVGLLQQDQWHPGDTTQSPGGRRQRADDGGAHAQARAAGVIAKRDEDDEYNHERLRVGMSR